MPIQLPSRLLARTGLSVLEGELIGEQASALGRAGREVETAMGALHAFEGAPDAAERRALVRAAARAVWAYWVQREACGLLDHRQVIREHRIPREVLNRLGAG
ncbi:MAG: DUF6665 family protein [Phenylobacterium sp.]